MRLVHSRQAGKPSLMDHAFTKIAFLRNLNAIPAPWTFSFCCMHCFPVPTFPDCFPSMWRPILVADLNILYVQNFGLFPGCYWRQDLIQALLKTTAAPAVWTLGWTRLPFHHFVLTHAHARPMTTSVSHCLISLFPKLRHLSLMNFPQRQRLDGMMIYWKLVFLLYHFAPLCLLVPTPAHAPRGLNPSLFFTHWSISLILYCQPPRTTTPVVPFLLGLFTGWAGDHLFSLRPLTSSLLACRGKSLCIITTMENRRLIAFPVLHHPGQGRLFIHLSWLCVLVHSKASPGPVSSSSPDANNSFLHVRGGCLHQTGCTSDFRDCMHLLLGVVRSFTNFCSWTVQWPLSIVPYYNLWIWSYPCLGWLKSALIPFISLPQHPQCMPPGWTLIKGIPQTAFFHFC